MAVVLAAVAAGCWFCNKGRKNSPVAAFIPPRVERIRPFYDCLDSVRRQGPPIDLEAWVKWIADLDPKATLDAFDHLDGHENPFAPTAVATALGEVAAIDEKAALDWYRQHWERFDAAGRIAIRNGMLARVASDDPSRAIALIKEIYHSEAIPGCVAVAENVRRPEGFKAVCVQFQAITDGMSRRDAENCREQVLQALGRSLAHLHYMDALEALSSARLDQDDEGTIVRWMPVPNDPRDIQPWLKWLEGQSNPDIDTNQELKFAEALAESFTWQVGEAWLTHLPLGERRDLFVNSWIRRVLNHHPESSSRMALLLSQKDECIQWQAFIRGDL